MINSLHLSVCQYPLQHQIFSLTSHNQSFLHICSTFHHMNISIASTYLLRQGVISTYLQFLIRQVNDVTLRVITHRYRVSVCLQATVRHDKMRLRLYDLRPNQILQKVSFFRSFQLWSVSLVVVRASFIIRIRLIK